MSFHLMTQSISRSTRPRSSDSTALRPPLPQVERPLDRGRRDAAAVDEVAGLAEVLGLDLQRARLAAVGQPDLAPTGDVVADLADRPRIGFSIVRSRITTPSSIIRRHQVAGGRP
jgi:hypothetical protein